MNAAIMAATARIADSGFGRFWAALGSFFDCAIPLTLAALIVIGSAGALLGLF